MRTIRVVTALLVAAAIVLPGLPSASASRVIEFCLDEDGRTRIQDLLPGESCERVRRLFANDPKVQVPEIYPEWSTRRVLVMPFAAGVDPQASAGTGAALWLGEAAAILIAAAIAYMTPSSTSLA